MESETTPSIKTLYRYLRSKKQESKFEECVEFLNSKGGTVDKIELIQRLLANSKYFDVEITVKARSKHDNQSNTTSNSNISLNETEPAEGLKPETRKQRKFTDPLPESIEKYWTKKDGLRIYHNIPKLDKVKIAAFDMVNYLVTLLFQDKTILEPKSGSAHPKDRGDWKWLYPEVPKRLKELYEEKYFIRRSNSSWHIVIFTNQAGIGAVVPEEAILGKIMDISNEV
jgi:hypothetical protein